MKNKMIKETEAKRTLLACSLSVCLAACTGSSTDSLTLTSSSSCAVSQGQPSTATYTISWDAVVDTDLSGYVVYYGSSDDFNKHNALGSVDVGNTTMVTFKPSDYDITTCNVAKVGITAIGSRPESALSDIQTIIVE